MVLRRLSGIEETTNHDFVLTAEAYELNRNKGDHLKILKELLDSCKDYRHIHFGIFWDKDFVNAQITVDPKGLENLKKHGWSSVRGEEVQKL